MEELCELSQLMSRQGGHDYEFVAPLDIKYECRICLLAMRNPHQTVCGHRFCRDCITNCISMRSVCPIDNRPLMLADVFPDACIEREILELEVLCPGHEHGCNRKTTLRKLQLHVQACKYQVVLCPNQCANTVLCGELQQHLNDNCALRLTQCTLCNAVYTLDKEELHRAVCGDVEVGCDACGEVVLRGNLTTHVTTQCPDTLIACQYAEFGCTTRPARRNFDSHLSDNTQQHLQLVSAAYKKMNTFVSELSRTVGLIQSPSFSRQASLRSQLSASSPSDDRPRDRGEENGYTLKGDNTPANEAQGEERDKKGAVSKLDGPKRESIAHEAQRHQLQLHNLNSGFESSSSKLSSNEKILRNLNEKTVDMDQRMLEETIRLDNLSKQMEGLEQCMNDKVTWFSGRFCNGDYLWRVSNFSSRCADIKNKNLSTYSPPFYTSQFGYKCCIRMDVKWRDDQYYLSLYILLMKGENDDVLDWPFEGRITLAVLDQNPHNSPKKHLVDNVQSNPILQAFQRPQTSRNDKSFGFSQFYPLETLGTSDQKEGVYLVKDVLCVMARVVPKVLFCDILRDTLPGDADHDKSAGGYRLTSLT